MQKLEGNAKHPAYTHEQTACHGDNKEVSSNVVVKYYDRRRELYEIIKRAQTQRIEVVPILLEKMQERIISNNSKDMLIPSSRLNKAHRVGRLKFSGMLILNTLSQNSGRNLTFLLFYRVVEHTPIIYPADRCIIFYRREQSKTRKEGNKGRINASA